MTRAQVIYLLNECEERFPFAQKAWIGDVNVWPLIKIKIGEQLVAADMYKNNTAGVPKNTMMAHIKGGLDLVLLNKKISNAGNVLFMSNAAHWTKVNDCWADRFSHPFIELMDGLKVRSAIAHSTKRPNGKNCRPCTEINLQYALHLKSLYWWRSADRPELPQEINDCIEWIQDKSGTMLDLSYLNEMVFTLFFYDRFFSDLLKNTGLKSIFFVCFYSVHNMGLSQAASRLGISTVDIQHGVQGANHIAYGNWNMPTQGYATLPHWFWCWNKKDADHIALWANNTHHKAIAGGDLWSEAWRRKDLTIKMSTELPQVPPGDVVVLFSLQPVKDELPLILINAIRSSKNIQWWLRVHPSQANDPRSIEDLLNKNDISDKVHFKSVSALPLPKVLSKVDLHTTNWSSVVLDAERFGIPSILLHPTGRAVYSDMLEQEHVHYFSGRADELLKMIKSISSNPHTKRSSVQNPIEGLQTILQR